MKNNKGFTLIELLAIVVILGIIIALAVPSMTREIKRQETEEKNVLNQKIENATRIYAAKYYSNKIIQGEKVEFKLKDLVDDGLISFKGNVCKEYLSNNISISNGKYDYSKIESSNCYTKKVISSTEESKKTTTTKPIIKTEPNQTTTGSQIAGFFDGINNYKTKALIGTGKSNEKTVTLKPCVISYKINKFIQGFAITEDFIYLSTANNRAGTSVWTNDLTEESLKNISSNIYYRINRNDNTTSSIINEYAGHAQSFDVASKYVDVNGTKEDQLFFNAVPYFGLTYSDGRKGAGYQGFAYNTFKGSNGKIIPGSTFALIKDPVQGKAPAKVIKRDSETQKSIEERIENHIERIAEIRNLNGGSITKGNSNYMINPELAVDEKNDKIAFSVGKKVYVYNLSKLKNNTTDAYIFSFNSNRSGLQGLELYGSKLYMVQGGAQNINYNDNEKKIDNKDTNFTFDVEVYNIKNTSNVTSNKYNLTVDYSKILNFSQDKYWSVEPEGISIYDEKPYLLLMRTEKNSSGKSLGFYIDIIIMEE